MAGSLPADALMGLGSNEDEPGQGLKGAQLNVGRSTCKRTLALTAALFCTNATIR